MVRLVVDGTAVQRASGSFGRYRVYLDGVEIHLRRTQLRMLFFLAAARILRDAEGWVNTQEMVGVPHDADFDSEELRTTMIKYVYALKAALNRPKNALIVNKPRGWYRIEIPAIEIEMNEEGMAKFDCLFIDQILPRVVEKLTVLRALRREGVPHA